MTPEELEAIARMFKPKEEGEYVLPLEVAERYNFPQATGKGQKIAVISFGGGYEKKYLEAYFSEICGLESYPSIVDKCLHVPGPPEASYNYRENLMETLFTAELYANLELLGAIANEATIVVYHLANIGQKLGQLSEAIGDAVKSRCDIVLICYSTPEKLISDGRRVPGRRVWHSNTTRDGFDRVLNSARKNGVTVCVSAGNSLEVSSLLKENILQVPEVEFPGSHPLVLSVGGTVLPKSTAIDGVETAWNEVTPFPAPFPRLFNTTTGGFSTLFQRPEWQQVISTFQNSYSADHIADKRGVPDVSAHASSNYGYRILFGPHTFDWVGATSSAAPIWAGLIARLNEKLGFNVGFVNEALYKIAYSSRYGKAFNDVTTGNANRRVMSRFDVEHPAQSNWDTASGLGSPNGKILLEALKNSCFHQ